MVAHADAAGSVPLEQVGTLDVAAGSGLVFHGGALVVVADDGLALSRYDLAGAPLGTIRLFEGELPADPIERKRVKPDLEALVQLPDRSLLAVPSGSKRRRCRGARVVGTAVAIVDFAPLFAALEDEIRGLNVEGAALLGNALALFTRRTGDEGCNAIIRLRLLDTLAALQQSSPRLTPALLDGVTPVDLGAIGGTPLGFTDATEIDRDTVLFSAAAEATANAIDDGPVAGCVIGRLDARGRVLSRRRVDAPLKIEGLAIVDRTWVYAVADADDPRVFSPLVRARLDRF